MTYKLRIENKRDVKTCQAMLKAPGGNYHDHVTYFWGTLYQPFEGVVEVINIPTINQVRIVIKRLRQDGVMGVIALLENCDETLWVLEYIPAVPRKPKKAWDNLHECVVNARSVYAGLSIGVANKRLAALSEIIFPAVEVGDITTIGELWKNGINTEFDHPIPPIGDWAECEISEYGESDAPATLHIWYKLAHDAPNLYSDGNRIRITYDNVGVLDGVEIEITRITNW